MNDPTRLLHPFGRTEEEEDLNILTNGGDTGWWDDNGRPAPWPQDFLDADAGWTNGNGNRDADNPPEEDHKNPPF